MSLYTQVRKSEPRLRAWTELALARIRLERGDATALTALVTPAWSRSDGLTPGGLPVALAASAGVKLASPKTIPRLSGAVRDELEPERKVG